MLNQKTKKVEFIKEGFYFLENLKHGRKPTSKTKAAASESQEGEEDGELKSPRSKRERPLKRRSSSNHSSDSSRSASESRSESSSSSSEDEGRRDSNSNDDDSSNDSKKPKGTKNGVYKTFI